MSGFVQKPGQGSLFRNENKAGETHPDYKGNFTNKEGEKCNVAAWVKTAKNGNQFLSLSLEFAPYQPSGQPQAQQNPAVPLELNAFPVAGAPVVTSNDAVPF